jgi:hypothetical protein
MQRTIFSENALAQSRQYDWSVIGKRYVEEYQALYCQSTNGSNRSLALQ